MKIRRVFWNHHMPTSHKVVKMQTDYDEDKSHQECAGEILGSYGRFENNPKRAHDSFAEVISSTITEKDRVIEAPFETPKHLGTDLLLNPIEYANMFDASKEVKRKGKKVV